jgi:uncharacterized protein
MKGIISEKKPKAKKTSDSDKVGFFRFKKIDNSYLITNEVGEYIFLKPSEFENFSAGKTSKKSALYKDLSQKNFLKSDQDIEVYAEKYQKKNQHLCKQGPSLHIIVITLRCNHNCCYCQASSKHTNDSSYDMDIETAKSTVDFIFDSPNRVFAIEFQGGEPLMNWPTLKFIVEYARKKNKDGRKNVDLRLVSNYSVMDKKKAEYLFKNRVTFCTSLDGKEKVHNQNRFWAKGNSHKTAVKWTKYLLKEYKKHYEYKPAALTTITRFSLSYWKEIIDEYISLGFDSIFLRALAPLGIAKKSWEKIGYSPQEFLDFYKKSLDYIFDINLKKKKYFREISTTLIATKILTDSSPNFLDHRSPCGAGIGQLLYNFNGDIFTCDEARMLNDDTFKLGNVKKETYSRMISSQSIKAMCLSSCLDGLACDFCVYKPYCGVCPVVNFAETGNIFAQMPNSSRCLIYKGIFDYLFQKIRNDVRIKEVLMAWVGSGSKEDLAKNLKNK